jgi:hypothetical protein
LYNPASQFSLTFATIATDFVDKTIKVSELLVDREKAQTYKFLHHSFQDYLTAYQLHQLKQPKICCW